jgi:hypothetical protein
MSSDLNSQFGSAVRNLIRNMGIAAIVCGTVPLVPGVFGIFRPASRRLMLVSLISTLLLVLATSTLYFEASRLYGTVTPNSVMPESGTYIAGIVAAIEIGAGIIARHTFTPRGIV